MKRAISILLSVILLAGLLFPITTSAAGVDITAEFTDPNFLAAVYRRIGKTAPAPIYDTDVAAIIDLSVDNKNIQSLAGLEYFVGLGKLYCNNNQLTSLPALPSGLLYIECDGNLLTSLPALPAGLVKLWCKNNMLTGIDLSGTKLFQLDCRYNNMTSAADVIGFTGSSALFNFDPQANKYTLNKLLAEAKAIKKSGHTRSTWNALQTAIASAQAVLNDASAARGQIIEEIHALQRAMQGVQTYWAAFIGFLWKIPLVGNLLYLIAYFGMLF